ncbi:Inositol transporter 1 [Galdieria sulphuraria]|nr:Inositol transporter 1 [Galdieria sulphuraria]
MASSRTEERSIQTSIVEKARYAVGGDSEEEIEAELHKLEHCCVSHRQYFIFALPIFGKAKYFVWILASLASLYIPEDLHYDSNIESIISGFMPLGGIFGAFLVYPANELFGRKWSIASACLLDICGEKKEFFWMEQQVLKEMQESKDRWNVLDFVRKPRCRRAAQYAIILMILQQFSGINTINHYMGILMLEIGMNKQNAVYMSVIGGATGLLSTIPAIYLVDRLGRRTLLLSFIGGVFCGLLIIGFSFLTTNIRTKVGLYIWGVVVYYLFWGSCLGPIPWVVGSEVWPTYLRSQGLCIADISKWIGEFVTTFAFPYMVNAMKKTGIFCGFYAGIILMGTLYLMFFMPETKCKTLEELEEVFHQPMRVLLKQNKNNLKETWQALKGFHVNKIWLCSP